MHKNQQLPPAVNFHLVKQCNYKCRFCFATFNDTSELRAIKRPSDCLPEAEAIEIISLLPEAGVTKLTFAGGEPTLCSYLGAAIRHAKECGLTTSIVSNGTGLVPLLETHAQWLDWVALSIDSAVESTNVQLGRGKGEHIEQSIAVADLLHARRIRVKLNTVVTSLTIGEDISRLVNYIRPERWKIFKVLMVGGQNDACHDLAVTDKEFEAFVDRHRFLESDALTIVPETNEDMTGSYAMIDPLGRFFCNATGKLSYSRPILDAGVGAAFAELHFDQKRFHRRGGEYNWVRPVSATFNGAKHD